MKKNILITYNFILHYRKPLFNLLSKDYNVTVLHSGKKTVSDQDLYSEIIVPVLKKGPLYLQKDLLKEVQNKKYDVIIALFDVRWIYTIYSIFQHNKSAKFILWGAWLTKNTFANKLRLFLTRKADASIFYTFSSMQDFINKGSNKNNLYVANNTFDVGGQIKSFENDEKYRILFVGSLDKRKQNDVLIKAFSNITDIIPQHIQLTIIGDGTEKEILKNLVKELQLNDRISFTGRINNPNELKKYYSESILSASFGQAGLSVLQALGFGVPFLTKKNAITGGEITNVKDKYNGILCDDNIKSLEDSLIFAVNNIDIMRELGKNAYNYYSEFCTIENYALGFKDAIEGTRLAKVDSKKY